MSIASDAPGARTPSVTRSALLRRKIRGRCVRSSVSSAAGSYGRKRKDSITIRLRRHATSGAGERESRSEKSSREYQEILRVEAATPRTARSGGVSGMLPRTTDSGADLIGGTVSAGLGDRTPRERAETIVAASAVTSQVTRRNANFTLPARHSRPLARSTFTSSVRDSCNAAAHAPCGS